MKVKGKTPTATPKISMKTQKYNETLIRPKDHQLLQYSKNILEFFQKNTKYNNNMNVEDLKAEIKRVRSIFIPKPSFLKPAIFVVEGNIGRCCFEKLSNGKRETCTEQFSLVFNNLHSMWDTLRKKWQCHSQNGKIMAFSRYNSVFLIKSGRNVRIGDFEALEKHADDMVEMDNEQEIGNVTREKLAETRKVLGIKRNRPRQKQFNANISKWLEKIPEQRNEEIVVCETGYEFKRKAEYNGWPNRFNRVYLVKDKEGFEMGVPPSGFSITDFAKLYGEEELVPVINSDNENVKWQPLMDFIEKFQNPNGKDHLNVLSLEFSGRKGLECFQPPRLVKEISLESQLVKEIGNIKEKWQNYYVASMAGSYTKYHIDFGGSSVFFHVFEGWKTFLLVPPTKKHLKLFTKFWKGKRFQTFGEWPGVKLIRVDVRTGETLVIPSGWIHAVYTHTSTTGYSGNFLNQANLEKQFDILKFEEEAETEELYKMNHCQTILWALLGVLLRKVKECNKKRQCMARKQDGGSYDWAAFNTLLQNLKIESKELSDVKTQRKKLLEECKKHQRLQIEIPDPRFRSPPKTNSIPRSW